MPFPYYQRLSTRDKAIYRKSAAMTEVPLPDARALRPAVSKVREGLERNHRADTERAAQALVRELTTMLKIPPVAVRVLSRRPSNATSELHGLYVLDEEGATIRVWMKTAAHRKVVSFRTFLRTLLHEVCHHLDFTLYRWPESFHTEGFFKRESSLMRQLVPTRSRTRANSPVPEFRRADVAAASMPDPPIPTPRLPRRGRPKPSKTPPRNRQLDLPFA